MAMSSSLCSTPSASLVICLHNDMHHLVCKGPIFALALLVEMCHAALLFLREDVLRGTGSDTRDWSPAWSILYLRSAEMNRGDLAMAHSAKWDLISSIVSSSLKGSPICKGNARLSKLALLTSQSDLPRQA